MVVISVPVYYTQTFKTKKPKTFLVNLNWARNSHYHIANKVKQHYNAMIIAELQLQNATRIEGPYEVAMKYYYKNKSSDLDNITSQMLKYANDAFQQYGLVENDNIKFCKRICSYVGDEDKDNPRVEIFIRQYKESADD